MSGYRPALRFPLILFITYLSFVGGMVDTTPLMKVIHQVGFALIMGAWLWGLARSERGFPVTRLNGPVWALGAAWLIAAVAGTNPRISFEYVWTTFVHIMLLFIFIDLIRAGHQRWLMEGLFISGSVVVIIGIIEMLGWYFGWSIVPGGPVGWLQLAGFTTIPPTIHELSAPLSHNNLTGGFAVMLVPLALAWGNTKPQRDLRWALRFLALCLLGVVVLTQSRGAYLALMTIAGVLAFFWLLRPDVRDRLPQRLQSLVSLRYLLASAVICGLIGFIMLYSMFLGTSKPHINDISRLNLWYSAIEMFRDHPLMGVGPFLFRVERLSYSFWDKSYLNIGLNHAHNLPLNVIAEGGIVVLTAATWGIVRFFRVWWDAWNRASRSDKRRLEGVLAACCGFFIHNLVDAMLETQSIIPLLIALAYVASLDLKRDQDEPAIRQRWNPARVQIWASVIVLVAAQIAFIPLHRGALKQQRFLQQTAQEDYTGALETIREAKDADPWLDLYDFEESMTLARLANDDPDQYLTAAIQSFESTLSDTPAWDVGWHNLAALYAQAGMVDRAVEAEERAVALLTYNGYLLTLGEYYRLAGNAEAARQAYMRALKEGPWLAASDYWDGADRQDYLAAAVEQLRGETALALDVLVYAGRFDLVQRDFAREIDPRHDDAKAIQHRLDALWPGDSDVPCLYCYHVRDNPDLLATEIALHSPDPTPDDLNQAEERANRALFLQGKQAQWGWYILARIMEQTGNMQTPDAQERFESYLVRAASAFADYPYKFERVFRMNGALDYIPQARFPVVSSIAYEPWIRLAQWQAEHGELDDAADTVEKIRDADPYAAEARDQ